MWLGDSVHRGLFWDLVDFFSDTGDGAPLDARVIKRFVSQSFSNFEDQDLFVYRRGDRKPEHGADSRSSSSSNSSSDSDSKEREFAEMRKASLFSVRFIYMSNAVDFPNRCKLISDWFFQCLETVADIFRKVLVQEPSVGLVYWNTGLWDWRTGVAAEQYRDGIASLFGGEGDGPAAKLFARAGGSERVIWRATSASWPDKFMSQDECKKKTLPHDTRPCPVHTDQIKQYNEGARRAISSGLLHVPSSSSLSSSSSSLVASEGGLLRGGGTPSGAAAAARMAAASEHVVESPRIIDAWPITATRPDLSFDGLHFQQASCMTGKARNCESKTNPVYRTLNQMFFNALCPAATPATN